MEVNCRTKISNLVTFVFISPFCFGNPTATVNSDGSTSATVFYACSAAILFVTIGCFSAQPRGDPFASKILIAILVSLMVAGTVWIMILLVLIFCCRSCDIVRRQQFKHKSISLQLIFLWFSGLGVLLRTGISLAIIIDCIAVNSETTSEGIKEIFYTLPKITFMLLQMGAITYLRNTRLEGVLLTNYLIAVILLVNLSIWINFVTVKIADIYTFGKVNSSMTIPNATVYDYCYWHSKLQNISRVLNPFLLSINMLFLLISSMFLVRLWPSVGSKSWMERFKVDKNWKDSDSTRDNNDQIIDSNRQRLKSVKITSFFVGIFLVAPFFTMSVLMRFVYFNEIITVKKIWDVSVIVCLAIALVVVLVGIQNLDSISPIKLTMSTWDGVLLCCMAGIVVMNIIGSISATSCYVERSSTIFTKNVLHLFLTFYHSVYIILARRIPANILRNSVVSLSIHVILFVSYLGRWLLQTFLLSRHGEYLLKEGEDCVFSTKESWLIFQYFAIPLNAFYDFQSFVFYYSVIW
ncbi:uncharacterized protein LOC133172016 [Saccostrea echinata]|uniref:uncharacterized protein LOC133172016 n=1 Tax=Saccostrea echinata TaxID=191078 RepID=UPI002A82F481|nr:uncharacterized protein LOC133172016 [Saccostrea echinata]